MKRVVVFFVLAVVVVGFVSAQNTVNDAQRLVGTWVGVENGYTYTLVLNANGTGTFMENGETENIFWGISLNGELYVSDLDVGIFYMSPDGRRMIWLDVVFQKR